MHDFTDFPSAKFREIWTQHVDRCRDESFWNTILKISRKGLFFQKTQKSILFFFYVVRLLHKSAMIIDRRKFMSSFHFYRSNQLKVIPVAWTLRTRNVRQKFLRRRTRLHGMPCHNDASLKLWFHVKIKLF